MASGGSAQESKALLSKVVVTDAVLQSCLAHALTTEKEEVMGVLLGNIALADGVPPTRAADDIHSSSPRLDARTPMQSKVTTIWASHIMPRSVRRSDRVEVAPESLISASDKAEELTEATGLHTRVVGWYHSHPRITAVPSTVDLNSQKRYQQMESGWVGLIFGVFNTDDSNRNSCSLHCFQAGANAGHIRVPVEVLTAPQLGLPITIAPSSHAMLMMFGEEVDAAVEEIRRRTENDAPAMVAARGLRQMQLYRLERLIGEPSVKYFEWCSVALLEAEVDRLEAELRSLSQ